MLFSFPKTVPIQQLIVQNHGRKPFTSGSFRLGFFPSQNKSFRFQSTKAKTNIQKTVVVGNDTPDVSAKEKASSNLLLLSLPAKAFAFTCTTTLECQATSPRLNQGHGWRRRGGFLSGSSSSVAVGLRISLSSTTSVTTRRRHRVERVAAAAAGSKSSQSGLKLLRQ